MQNVKGRLEGVINREYASSAVEEAHGRSTPLEIHHQVIDNSVPYIALFLQKVKLVGEKYLAINIEGSEGQLIVKWDGSFRFGKPIKPGQEEADHAVDGILSLHEIDHYGPGCKCLDRLPSFIGSVVDIWGWRSADPAGDRARGVRRDC